MSVSLEIDMKFADPFDHSLALSGPTGLFTLTHEGEVQFDLFRTRDWKRRFSKTDGVMRVSWNHCVCIDSETKWPMYVLITGTELVCSDERTLTTVFETMEEALRYVAEQKTFIYESSQKTGT